MIEHRPISNAIAHGTLIAGILFVALPLWIAFVASTHDPSALISGVTPLLPGDKFFENYSQILGEGLSSSGAIPVWRMLFNSLVMALAIAIGKIIISLLSAYAVVYFRFPGRQFCFWLIFITLMLPVEVRITPTYDVVASLGMLNSFAGLSIPIIASATATFLLRQFFMTIPDELVEAARIDGAGPWRFFIDVLLPLTRTMLAALFVILFIYGWNQYLWPLIVTTDHNLTTIVMGIQRMVNVADQEPQWQAVMATAVLALLPPVVVVVAMQKLFVRGLVETEK
ncbi:MAG: sn-glycerol-3-phosphate ABC transporter permease UgpE [Kiloniellales bacterium]